MYIKLLFFIFIKKYKKKIEYVIDIKNILMNLNIKDKFLIKQFI